MEFPCLSRPLESLIEGTSIHQSKGIAIDFEDPGSLKKSLELKLSLCGGDFI